MKQLISHSSEETERIAEQFAKKLRPGDIVTTPDIPDLEFEVIARADQ